MGPGGLRIAEAVAAAPGGGRITVDCTASLEEAVHRAVAATPAGAVVLFSPAQPTPSAEGDYRARSRRFVSAAGLPPMETGGKTAGRPEAAAERANP